MIKQLRNLIRIVIIFILLSLFFNNYVFATTTQNTDININDVNTTSPSCILMDAKSGKILYAKNAYNKMYPASTTKIMTAILALENCNLDDIATVSHYSIYSIPVGYSHANLQEGEELTIEQLLNVLLIPSANDSAIVLAEHISGSEEEFCKLMNEKAKELGCINTNFVNPNGIHNVSHYSTAYDLALIGQYAMQFSDIMRIAMTRQYTLPITNKYNKTNRIFNATNALINNESLNTNYYEYATGLKTGYTDTSGSCIVATAEKDDVKLIVVILGSSSINKRYNDCKTLFNYGFENYSYLTLHNEKDIIQTIEIKNATNDTKNLDVAVKNEIKILTKKNYDETTINPIIEINSDLEAPIAENTVIGKISYKIDNEIYSSDLVSASNVYSSSFEVIIFRLLLIFLILYIIYRLLHLGSKHKPHNKRNKICNKKTSKKNVNNLKNRTYKIKKSQNSDYDFHKIHTGKGNFKFTQINDYL